MFFTLKKVGKHDFQQTSQESTDRTKAFKKELHLTVGGFGTALHALSHRCGHGMERGGD
jgi:hypothetical protein